MERLSAEFSGISKPLSGQKPLFNQFPHTLRFRTANRRSATHTQRRRIIGKNAKKNAKTTAMSKIAISGHSTQLSTGPARSGKGLLAEIATFWREFIKTVFVPYYPERHYMRGPGPACAAKRKAASHK